MAKKSRMIARANERLKEASKRLPWPKDPEHPWNFGPPRIVTYNGRPKIVGDGSWRDQIDRMGKPLPSSSLPSPSSTPPAE